MRSIISLTSILCLLPEIPVEAQDKGTGKPKETGSSRFFKDPVDLWKTGSNSTPLSPSIGPADSHPHSKESIWAEPMTTISDPIWNAASCLRRCTIRS